MTAVEPYHPPAAPVPAPMPSTAMERAADFSNWAPKLQAAAAIAEKVAHTEFVPKALRGKPTAVAAAILAGSEMNLGPMASLMHVHIIDGRPALDAEMTRALVLAQGHTMWFEEMTTERCVVHGHRRDHHEVTTVRWTMDDARRAGLAGKDVWRKYPRRMLAARASAELSRLIFTDALGGMAYVAEELEDDSDDTGTVTAEDGAQPAVRSAQRRKRPRAPLAAVASPPTATPDAPAGPPLPGEDDTAPADTGAGETIVETEPEAPADTASVGDTAERDPGAPLDNTRRNKLFAIFRETDFDDRGDRLRITSRILDRTVESWADLTAEEGDVLLDTFAALKNKGRLVEELTDLLRGDQ